MVSLFTADYRLGSSISSSQALIPIAWIHTFNVAGSVFAECLYGVPCLPVLNFRFLLWFLFVFVFLIINFPCIIVVLIVAWIVLTVITLATLALVPNNDAIGFVVSTEYVRLATDTDCICRRFAAFFGGSSRRFLGFFYACT